MPNKIGLATLQRLSGLLPSSASPEEKMEVAAMVADSRTRNVVAETKQKDLKKQLKLGQQLKHPAVVLFRSESIMNAHTQAQSPERDQTGEIG